MIVIMIILESFQIIIHHRSNSISKSFFCSFVYLYFIVCLTSFNVFVYLYFTPFQKKLFCLFVFYCEFLYESNFCWHFA